MNREQVSKPRLDEKSYRVEFFQYGRWQLYYSKSIGKGETDYVWEEGNKGTFFYEEQARAAAMERSRRRPSLKFRVTNPHTGDVRVVFQNGQVAEGRFSHEGSREEGGQMTAARAEFYMSTASIRPTGPGTGMNAPEDGSGRWVSAYGCTSMREAERLYAQWSQSRSYYKRCRIVAEDGTVIKDTIYPGGIPPEGAKADMSYDNATIEEALTVPRQTLIDKIKASIEEARTKHNEQQQALLDENAARIAKVQKVAQDGWLVLKLTQYVISDIGHLEDADEVYKAIADYFGKQPGTAEFEADRNATKLLSVLEAATDENLAVKPGTNLYNYL